MKFFDIIIQRFLRHFFKWLYSHLAWAYDLVATIVSSGLWKDWVLSALPYLKGIRILELGYGPGHLQAALRKRHKKALGIDISFQMARIASKRLHKVGSVPQLIQGSAECIPFPAGWFDQVVATFPSEYIMTETTLLEIYRVLNAGGSLIILPAAWLTGASLVERGLALLFRITRQSPKRDLVKLHDAFTIPLVKAGFETIELISIPLRSSEVLIVIAQK